MFHGNEHSSIKNGNQLYEDVTMNMSIDTKIIDEEVLNVNGTALKNLKMICMKAILNITRSIEKIQPLIELM